MDRHIIGMGIKHFPFKNGQVSFYSSSDRKSLMDGDVILFSPQFFNYSHHQEYKGKPLLTENQSRIFQNELQHWTTEFDNAIKEQKTIFIFCENPKEFYYIDFDSFLGRKTCQEKFDPLCFFSPSYLKSIRSTCFNEYRVVSGNRVEYFDKNKNNKKINLKPLWDDFKEYFRCEMTFPNFLGKAYFVPKYFDPKRKSEVFGGIIKTPSGGFLIVLPVINFRHPDLFDEDNRNYKEKAHQLSNQLIKRVVRIDQMLKNTNSSTPPPPWLSDSQFKVQDIEKIKRKIQKADQDKINLEKDLEKAKMPHKLLFETGKHLEEAVIVCLKLMGFEANPYQDKDSEFDVVFTSKERTCLGEVEG